MNGRNKDIDPATELVEEDDEQALPEAEDAVIDLDQVRARPAARRWCAVAKLAPSSPGVYRMLDGGGEVLYVGKAKNIRKRIVAYTQANRARHPHRTGDRGDRDGRVRQHRHRNRGAAARSQPDQAAAPALQRAAA